MAGDWGRVLFTCYLTVVGSVLLLLLLLQNVDVYDEDDDDDDDGCDDDDDSDDDCDSDEPGIVYRSAGADVEAGAPCSHKLQRCTWHSATGGGSTLIL